MIVEMCKQTALKRKTGKSVTCTATCMGSSPKIYTSNTHHSLGTAKKSIIAGLWG